MGRIAESTRNRTQTLATEMIEESLRGRCLQVIRDIHAKRRSADTEKRETSLNVELCTITKGYYRANDVGVDEVALAQLHKIVIF